MSHSIVSLDTRHRAEALHALVEAFRDDPGLSWIQPDDHRRYRALPTLFQWLLDTHLAHGHLLGTPDATAVALWFQPDCIHTPPPLRLPDVLRMANAFGVRIGHALLISHCIERHLPPGEDWWYLRYVAVRPDQQGKGLGGAVIRAGIAQARERGLPVFLETCKPDNMQIYRSLGFRVHSEWDVPLGGPHFWTMVRPVD